MESKIVKADFKKLNAFLKDIEHAGDYKVKVGIMGAKNVRSDSKDQTNADIGFIHEFGRPSTGNSPAIPMRSFIRMPIFQKSERIIGEVRMILKTGVLTIVDILTILGISAERAIMDAFDTKGFGSWKANAPSTIRRKAGHTGSTSPLIDFGFLRKSISSEVVRS